MTKILENHVVVARKMKMKLSEFNAKYDTFITQESIFIESEARYAVALKTILTERATKKESRKLFLVYPEEFGYSKKATILIASKEPMYINSRMTEGYSVFELKVEISDKGNWASKFLYVFHGALWVTDLSTSPQLSQLFDFRKLKNKQLGFANYDKAFAKRRHISKAEYRRLRISGKLKYVVSPHGNEEIISVRKREKYEFVK